MATSGAKRTDGTATGAQRRSSGGGKKPWKTGGGAADGWAEGRGAKRKTTDGRRTPRGCLSPVCRFGRDGAEAVDAVQLISTYIPIFFTLVSKSSRRVMAAPFTRAR